MTPRRQSERPPLHRGGLCEPLPPAVGLCPDHAEEFYLPLSLPLERPFVRCPVPECQRYLTIYVPVAR